MTTPTVVDRLDATEQSSRHVDIISSLPECVAVTEVVCQYDHRHKLRRRGTAHYAPNNVVGDNAAVFGRLVTTLSDVEFFTKYVTVTHYIICLLYTSPSPRDGLLSRMPSSA